MKANYNTTNRKKLVKEIEQITESKAKYLGAPTFAYEIAEFRVNRDGTIESEDDYELKILIESLAFQGILTRESEEAEPEEDHLTIWMPTDSLSRDAIDNLKRIAEAKQELFKRAFGGDISILDEGDRVGFPWFPLPQNSDEMNAYSHFIERICNMARIQKRVSIKQHPVENEKYEFRCFLLRIGFIGAEYKGARKVLLKNLSGSAAFKNK